MQAPGPVNLSMFQGADWDYQLTWEIAGEPVNLASYTARMQARPNTSSSTIVLDLQSDAGITLGGSAGTITLALDSESTATVPSGKYVYDLELESPIGIVIRLIQGQLIVEPEVTRPVPTP